MRTTVLLALALSLASCSAGWLTVGGAVSATFLGSAVWLSGGLAWSAVLIWFFLTSSVLGRLTTTQKAPRNATQVICNGGAAGFVALLFLATGNADYAVAFVATVSAACADTWATEIGNRLGSRHFNVVTFAPSQPGPSGVCSVAGLAGALAGAATTAAFGLFLNLGPHMVAVCTLIGFVACGFDSILGASLQREGTRQGPLSNDTVNLVTTAAAAVAGYFLAS